MQSTPLESILLKKKFAESVNFCLFLFDIVQREEPQLNVREVSYKPVIIDQNIDDEYLGECPELVGLGVEQVEEKLTDLLVKLSAFHLPWNIILLG